VDVVRAALERLHAAHALVLDGDTREVRMALPFSNVATAYCVESAGRTWDANCAWDALALVRLLGLRDEVTRSGLVGDAWSLTPRLGSCEAPV
jgi:hypothetical protein